MTGSIRHVFGFGVALAIGVSAIPAANAMGKGQFFPVQQRSELQFPRIYVGGSGGATEADDEIVLPEGDATFVNIDDSDAGWKVFGGGQINPFIGLEVSYVDLGEFSAKRGMERAEVDLDGWNLMGMGVLPVYSDPYNHLSLFAKAGAFIWDADIDGSGSLGSAAIALSDEDDGVDPSFGVGIVYRLATYFAIRAEWERFFDIRDEDVDFFSIGLQIENFPYLR